MVLLFGRVAASGGAISLVLSLVLLVSAAHTVRAQALECGDNVPAGARVVLNADLVCSTATALTVEAGARLDMNGHTVRCERGVGIVLSGEGARLHDGTVVDCGRAVILRKPGRHRVWRVKALRHGPVEDTNTVGFDIEESDRNSLVRNEATGFQEGFRIVGDIRGSGRNRLSRNVARGGQIDFLIGRNNHRLHRNVSTHAIDAGFFVGGRGNRLVRNVALNSGIVGIAVGGSENRVIGNAVAGNFAWGILVGRTAFGLPATGNLIKRNRVLMNGDADLVEEVTCGAATCLKPAKRRAERLTSPASTEDCWFQLRRM